VAHQAIFATFRLASGHQTSQLDIPSEGFDRKIINGRLPTTGEINQGHWVSAEDQDSSSTQRQLHASLLKFLNALLSREKTKDK